MDKIKKFGPIVFRAVAAVLILGFMAREGMLEKFGVHYDKLEKILTIHFSVFNDTVDLAWVASIFGVTELVGNFIPMFKKEAQDAQQNKG